jgi:hypothetical protein
MREKAKKQKRFEQICCLFVQSVMVMVVDRFYHYHRFLGMDRSIG